MTSSRLYSVKLSEALHYAAELHSKQKRKGKNGAPYLGHLLSVCAIVIENGGSEDQAIAAILHDSIEDVPRGTKTHDEIKSKFGTTVLGIILELTHPPRPKGATHTELTDAYCQHLRAMTDQAFLVAIADKIHNSESIVHDLNVVGASALSPFIGGAAGVAYKYSRISDTISDIVGSTSRGHLDPLSRRLRTAADLIEFRVNLLSSI